MARKLILNKNQQHIDSDTKKAVRAVFETMEVGDSLCANYALFPVDAFFSSVLVTIRFLFSALAAARTSAF